MAVYCDECSKAGSPNDEAGYTDGGGWLCEVHRPKTYDVHIYAIVRVKVSGVKAPGPVDAISKAEAQVDLNEIFAVANRRPFEVEFADDVDGYLVNKVGDDDYSESQSYDKHKVAN